MISEALYAEYGIRKQLLDQSRAVLETLHQKFLEWSEAEEYKQLRVLQVLQRAGLTESSLGGSTGYGYDDRGRRALEEAFADYFGAQDAIVRHQFSSGTHVLATCLRGLLRPGEELICASGKPYDTICPVMGLPVGEDNEETQTPASVASQRTGSLTEFGISVRLLNLLPEGQVDLESLQQMIRPETRVIYLQKSRGYSTRPVLTGQEISRVSEAVHRWRSDLVVMVDNCYGEMTELKEPTACGADVCAGSLIKNLGAGIADTGAYICGRQDLVHEISQMMTTTEVGSHVGPTLGHTRNLARGFYFAPHVVTQALKGASHAAGLMQAEGYSVLPEPLSQRGDIVQLIALRSPEALCTFCEAIQAMSPVDSSFAPIPAPMAGYNCDIIMASGSFVQGSSIELSCDGPLRPPYHAYLQGGLSFANARLGVLMAAERLRQRKER